MRFHLALARANAVTTALGLAAGLVAVARLLGGQLLQLPFLQDAVAAGRVLPALFAGAGALLIAPDWGEFERVGSRSPAGLRLGRWAVGAAVAVGPAALAATPPSAVLVLYLLLGALATASPRHWWLALPPLLYLQLYLPPDLLPR